MGYKSILLILAIVILASTGCWSPLLADKRYEITGASIEAEVLPDGGLLIRESRSYNFVGSFSWAYRTLPLRPGVHYSQIQILENDRPYQNRDSSDPGTYSIDRDNDELTVRWNFRAGNQLRTFTFSYRVDGAVERYEDAAVLYYQFIGTDWDRRHQQVKLTVKPPQEIPAGEVRQWLHGPLWAASRTESDGSITALCEKLPAHQYLELRALYPPQLFTGLPLTERRITETVMREEAEWAEEANRRRQRRIEKQAQQEARHQMGLPVALVLAGLGMFLWVSVYRKYKKPQPPIPKIRLQSDIPRDMPPAWVGYLLNSRTISGNDMVATLFDLARRGLLQVSEEKVQKKKLFGGTKEKTVYALSLDRQTWQQKKSELKPFEDDLIDFFFNTLAEGNDRIDLDELQSKSGKMSSFFSKWQKKVSESAKTEHFFDAVSMRGMTIGLIMGFLLMLISGGLAFLFGLWLLLPLGVGFVLIFASFAISQRTAEGERLYRQWKGLEKYLKKYHFRTAERSAVLHNLDRYLIYGVALGLGKQIYEELAALIPQDQVAAFVPWYATHGGSFSPASFAPAFSSMVSTMSSSSGVGGGASTGGGGGAGGGGGGAG